MELVIVALVLTPMLVLVARAEIARVLASMAQTVPFDGR